MKKITMLFLLGLALGSQVLYAAEKGDGKQNAAGKGDSKQSFWQKLRIKIESMTPQKKTSVTTATGGVRGAPGSTEDIYWKNEATGQTIASEELEAFKKAMKLADSDDKAQAHAAFAEFIKKYPESSLRKDADQALALLGNGSAPSK
ncbi:MAG: hypothetical protein HY935_02845 [Nitrosomonadales bacterium]|nr:hypothetical protein [Nitrosomonadales bacterium]